MRKKILALGLAVAHVLASCGRSGSSRLKDMGEREAVFGISIDTGGNVRLGAESRGYTEVVGLGERGSRAIDRSASGSLRDGVTEVIRWARSVFDNDLPAASPSAALEKGYPLTIDRLSVGREMSVSLKSATRSGRTEEVEERYASLAEAQATVQGQYLRSKEVTASERERALRLAALINQRITASAQRHNQRVSEIATDMASLVEALKSVPQDSFKTDPATPSGAKLRRLTAYIAERSDELKAHTSLPEATKEDLVFIAKTAASLADESYVEGDTATGDKLVEIGYEAFEVAIGFTPSGVGVDLYKVVFGRDLLGRDLSDMDRVMAIAGVATLGLGGVLKSVSKGVGMTKRLVKALKASGRAAEAADHPGDVERLAVSAENVGIKGAGELKEIAKDLGDAASHPEKLAEILDSAKDIGLDFRKIDTARLKNNPLNNTNYTQKVI